MVYSFLFEFSQPKQCIHNSVTFFGQVKRTQFNCINTHKLTQLFSNGWENHTKHLDFFRFGVQASFILSFLLLATIFSRSFQHDSNNLFFLSQSRRYWFKYTELISLSTLHVLMLNRKLKFHWIAQKKIAVRLLFYSSFRNIINFYSWIEINIFTSRKFHSSKKKTDLYFNWVDSKFIYWILWN